MSLRERNGKGWKGTEQNLLPIQGRREEGWRKERYPAPEGPEIAGIEGSERGPN